MDFPQPRYPTPPILHVGSPNCRGLNSVGTYVLSNATSGTWPTANLALMYPFQMTETATVLQLLFYVGSVSSGNLDMGVYDSQKNLLVSAGSTAMSATTNTVQELNVTDTTIGPGSYYLAVACDNTTGTVFRIAMGVDDVVLTQMPVFEQAGLTAAALTNPGVPVLTTATSLFLPFVGIQFRSVF